MPSAHAIIDSVTCCGGLPSVVFFIIIMISSTFSAGKSCFGKAVGVPRIGLNSRLDSVLKIISTSSTFFECNLTSRTMAPPLGRLITKIGFLSVKVTPLRIKSSLLETSTGVVLTALVDMRIPTSSISSQVFFVVDGILDDFVSNVVPVDAIVIVVVSAFDEEDDDDACPAVVVDPVGLEFGELVS